MLFQPPVDLARDVLPDDTSDRAVIGGMLSYLAQRATAALRSERMRAGAVARIGASEGRLDAVVDRLRARHGFGVLLKGRAIDRLARVPADLRGLKLRMSSCSG